MKKFFVISVAVLFCLGMTLPAMATVKVGGMVTQDVYYFHQNPAAAYVTLNHGSPLYPGMTNPQSSFSAFDMGLPQAFNRLNVKYTNDDNSIRGFIEVRGGNGFGSNQGNSIGSPGQDLVWNYAWIDWVLSPKDFVRFGRQTQAFAIRAPDQPLGEARGHIAANNYGNIHGGTSRDGIRWFHVFTDQVHFEAAIYDPKSDGLIGTSAPNTPEFAGEVMTEQSLIPRIDLTAPLFFGPLRLWPSFTYLKQKFDDLAPGDADNYSIWGFALGGQYTIGPLDFQAEGTIGQNLGAANYVGEGGPGIFAGLARPALYVNSTGGTEMNDASVVAWWFQLGWKVGPATIQGMVGANHVKRDDAPPGLASAYATNMDRTLWMYGICVPIAIAKGFTIKPSLMFYDNDTKAKVGDYNVDYGREYLAGVQFMLVF